MNPKLILAGAFILSRLVAAEHCRSAIVYSAPPDDGKEIVYQRMIRPMFPWGTPSKLRVTDLCVADPCPTYGFSATNLAAAGLIVASYFSGWNYPLMYGTNVVGRGVAMTNKDMGKLEAEIFYYNKDSQANDSLESETVRALQLAEKLPRVQVHDYEFRRLDLISSPHFYSVWLHGKSDDLFIPLPPAYGMEAYHVYSEGEIARLLDAQMKETAKAWAGIFTPPPSAPVVEGLQMRLSARLANHPDDPQLELTLQNVGERDFILNLGGMLANGRYQLPFRIKLKVIDGVGKTWELNFMDRRFAGIAGRMDDYTVPLRAGSGYTLELQLNQFVLPDTGSPLELPAGHYEVLAEFQGTGSTISNSDMAGVKLLKFWKGSIESNVAGFTK